MNRLKFFVRESSQVYLLFFPILYVIIQLFIIYSIMVASLPAETPQEQNAKDKILSIILSVYLVIFLTLGQTLTSGGMYGNILMLEKKGGLRQMQHMMGISPTQYYLGYWLSDLTLHAMPVLLMSIIALFFPSVLSHEAVG